MPVAIASGRTHCCETPPRFLLADSSSGCRGRTASALSLTASLPPSVNDLPTPTSWVLNEIGAGEGTMSSISTTSTFASLLSCDFVINCPQALSISAPTGCRRYEQIVILSIKSDIVHTEQIRLIYVHLLVLLIVQKVPP